MFAGLFLIISWNPDSVYRKDPYLLFSKNDSCMTIMWQLYDDAVSILMWGRDTTYSSGNMVSQEYTQDHLHRALICGLEPGVKYLYRVQTEGITRDGSFRILPPGDTITFFIYGDTRTFPWSHDSVTSMIVMDYTFNPEDQTFVINTGDLVTNGDSETYWDVELFDEKYSNIREMFSSLPFMATMGNHEGNGILFKKYFPYDLYPSNRFYYSFDAGPVHFVVLDQYTDYSPESEQYRWLVNDLSSTRKKWKIILLHEPGWSAGPHGDELPVRWYIQPPARHFGVKFIIAGHNHNYARAEVDGVHHITSGGGGAPLYEPEPGRENVVKTDMSHHFLKIIVEGCSIRVQAIRSDGSLIEEIRDSCDATG